MLEIPALIIYLMKKFGRDLRGASYGWLNEYLVDKENRHGQGRWTVMVSVILVLAAIFYARLDTQCAYLGQYYAALAADPFAFDNNNPVGYRLLTPVISYLLGLHGRLIIFTNLIITGFFIAGIYSRYRRTAPQPGDAFLAAAVITFSLVVMTSIHCGGYCDIMSYLLIFMMWRFRTNRPAFYALFLLGLLNRESVLFLMPWFVFLTWERDRSKAAKLLDMAAGFGLTIGAYYLFREWVASHQTIPYSLSYYFGHFVEDPLRVW